MRVVVVVSSLVVGLTACSFNEPVHLATSDRSDGARAPDLDAEDETQSPSLPPLTCVTAAVLQGATPQVTRLFVSPAEGGAQVWASTGPQFASHAGVWNDTPAVDHTVVVSVKRANETLFLRGAGVDIALDGSGVFRSGEAFATDDAIATGSLTCWDAAAVFGSPWAEIPSALPARFDAQLGGCIGPDGKPALNRVPVEFVRETGSGDCADLGGQSLNGDDLSQPDLWLSLRGARLNDATLFFANLVGAFEGADLSVLAFGYATIQGSFDADTRLPAGDVCTATESPWGGSQIACSQ